MCSGCVMFCYLGGFLYLFNNTWDVFTKCCLEEGMNECLTAPQHKNKLAIGCQPNGIYIKSCLVLCKISCIILLVSNIITIVVCRLLWKENNYAVQFCYFIRNFSESLFLLPLKQIKWYHHLTFILWSLMIYSTNNITCYNSKNRHSYMTENM